MGRLAALAIAALTPLTVAVAQDAVDESTDARAKALFEEGTRLYESGRYEEAAEAFRIAYTLSGRPLLLFNMASALERIGRYEEALEALEGYLPHAPPDEVMALESRIQLMRTRVEEAPTDPPDEAPTPAEPVQREPLPLLPVALFATSGVGGLVGTVYTVRALNGRSQWKGLCTTSDGGQLCPVSAEDPWRRDNRNSLVADIGWGVGLGALGAGLVVTLGPKKDSDVVVRPEWGGLSVRGRW